MSVTPRGMPLLEAYREYRSGNFIVNRRYQRKLVWSLDEKRALIDSVLHDYPIPLILLAYSLHSDGSKSYEILDGMQRLNALFTFIENQFDVGGKYFDVSQLSRAKSLADEGAFKAESDPELLLTDEECSQFLEYTLAVTEFPATDETAVNEVFGRINSYGRQLSAQEKRQAGVVSSFANTVRELAAELRGDVSKDTLDLSEMPSISVDVAGEAPNYGIKADEVFWCKQGILRRAQLRESEDEQLIADLAISILNEKAFNFSGKNLDEYYDPLTDDGRNIEASIATYGATNLKSNIVGTVSILRETIEQFDSSANAFRRIVNPGGQSNPVKTAFFAVFFAFYELCVRQRRTPTDASEIMQALRNVQSRLNVSAGQIRSEPRIQNVGIVTGLIQQFFEEKESPTLLHGLGSSIQLENALRRSRIETAAFECKQGLVRLDNLRSSDTGLLDRIVETLCAIANIGPDSEGGLFIGVADSDADKKRVEHLDGIIAAQVGARFVVGIDRELNYLKLDLEGYKRAIVNHLGSSELSEPLKSDILARIDCIAYRGLSVICLWIPKQSQVSTVGDRTFIRRGSSTVEVTGVQAITAVIKRFS
ncbi:MAG: DUF262 domain-containing protein [Alphaproteobacteria bacterium]